jgi:proline dehydrogenase
MDVMNVLSHFDDTKTAFSYKSNYELKRAYILFKLLSYPSLAFIGKHLLNLLIKIHFPIDNLIKKTIFEQFCGGENEKECFKVINKLNENNIRCILNYSIEGSNTESNYEHTLNKTLNLIDLSEKQSVSSFIVFKPSAVGRFDLYLKKTNNDSLNENEIDEWQRVEQRYDQICNSAAKSGISILIDAEESWIQKSIDELIEKLMIKYNNSSCIVYNTIQTYRIDRFEYLSDLHKRLSKSNIKIGIKLVRGAYMEKERRRAKSNNYKSPICETKLKTDENYNNCMSFIFSNINDFNLFIGSHNERSNLLAIEIMEKHQIKNNDKRVWFSQLYGMSDNISFNLALNKYNVTKYLPFGPIKEVIPYLIRRLDENSSVSGQTSRELKLISKEIKRRKLESNN